MKTGTVKVAKGNSTLSHANKRDIVLIKNMYIQSGGTYMKQVKMDESGREAGDLGVLRVRELFWHVFFYCLKSTYNGFN